MPFALAIDSAREAGFRLVFAGPKLNPAYWESEIAPRLGPDATGLGWVYQYYLKDESGRQDLGSLRALQDYFIRYQLAAVPGVAEVAGIGGFVRQWLAPTLLSELCKAVLARGECGGAGGGDRGHRFGLRGVACPEHDFEPWRERRSERARVVGLRVAARTERHRAAAIHEQAAAQIRLVLEFLDVIPTGLAECAPVNVPNLVARIILSMLDKLDAGTLPRTAVTAHDRAFHQLPRNQLQTAKLHQLQRILWCSPL